MWLTLSDTAQYLKVSRETLYKLAQTEEIPCSKIGSQWRFHQDSIDKWMQKQSNVSEQKRTISPYLEKGSDMGDAILNPPYS